MFDNKNTQPPLKRFGPQPVLITPSVIIPSEIICDNKKTQPPLKRFGPQVPIHRPELSSSSEFGRNSILEGDDDPMDIQFDLRPKLPSHVPTPETIDRMDEPLLYHLQTLLFAGDADNSNEGTNSETKERRNIKNIPPAPVTPNESPVTSSGRKLLRRTPSTKWGPDVWKSLKSSNNSINSNQSNSTGDCSSTKSISSCESFEEINDSANPDAKWRDIPVLPEVTVKTKSNNGSKTPLQRQWIQENTLNLHSMNGSVHSVMR